MTTDLELVNATLAGDKSAFETLVLRYQTQVYRLVYRIIDNQSSAPDIVQEALLKAYENLQNLRDRARFSVWLFRIAKNQCISWNRKYQKNLHKNLTDVEDELANSRLHLPPAPDESLMERELHGQIMNAISRLPEYNREAVRLFYLEGKSYSEIQDELGITKGTLGRFLYEARAQLREKLQAFHQITVFLVGGSLKRALRLTAGKPGMAASVTAASTGKCIMISVLLHLLLFAGMSSTGLRMGSSGDTNGGSDYTTAIETSLVKARLSDPIPLSPVQTNSLRPLRNAEIAARSVSALTRLTPNLELRSAINVPHIRPPLDSQVADSDAAFLNTTAPPKLVLSSSRPNTSFSVQSETLSMSNIGQAAKGTFHDQASGPGILHLSSESQEFPSSTFSVTSNTSPIAKADSSKKTPPSSYGPFYQYDRMIKNAQEVLRSVYDRGNIEQYSASALQAITRRSPYSRVVVAECDLEVLKALLTMDVAPVVIMRSPVGAKHIRAIVEYDDSTEQLTLIDPVNHAKMRFSYSEFSRQWDDPQDACLLIFPRRTAAETIRISLTRYLPPDKIESISIRAPRRR
ncbi:RNA polymerase sigma factor [Candidatus Poribacteria bacterium]